MSYCDKPFAAADNMHWKIYKQTANGAALPMALLGEPSKTPAIWSQQLGDDLKCVKEVCDQDEFCYLGEGIDEAWCQTKASENGHTIFQLAKDFVPGIGKCVTMDSCDSP